MLNPPSISTTALGERRLGLKWVLARGDVRRGFRQRGALRTVSKLLHPLSGVRTARQDISATTVGNENVQRKAELVSGTAPVVPNAQTAARSLFTALNHRDVSAVLSLLADDVTYENLGSSTVLRGRAAVGRFYLEALAALPEDAMFVLEGDGGHGNDPWVSNTAGPVLQAGIAWRVELNGVVVPLSRGVGVYRADPRTGRLARIWDNPEHAVKQTAPALTSVSWASPLLQGLGPLVMPAALSVTSFLSNLGPNVSGGGGEAAVSGLPASSAGGPAGGGGGGASIPGGTSAGLAGSVMSTLSSMMPFKAGGPAASAAAAANRGVGSTTGSSAGSGASGAGAGAIVASTSRGPIFRDHTRTAQSSVDTSPAGGVATGAVVRANAGTTLSGTGSEIAAAGAGKMPPGSTGPAPRRGGGSNGSNTNNGLRTAAVASAAPTPAKPASKSPPGANTAVASVAAQASAAATTPAAGGATGAETRSSAALPIRMRPLPAAVRPASASVSAESSLSGAAAAAAPGNAAKASTTAVASNAASAVSTTGAVLTNKVAGAAAFTAAVTAPPKPSAPGPSPSGAVSMSQPIPRSSSSGSSSSNINNSNQSTTAANGSSTINSNNSDRGVVVFGSVDSGSETDSSVPASPLPIAASTSLAVNLTGLWEKDPAHSQVEEYESMLDVLELGGLQKVTARLIDGLDLRQDDQRFEVSFVTVVPFFRVTEKSRFGSSTNMMRRDLRSGRQTSLATRTPGGVLVDMSWEAPLAGSLREAYVISEDGTMMAVTSTIRIGPRSAVATQVYRRSGRNKSDFLASKRSSYGSLQDVLNSQEKRYGTIEY